MVTNTDTGLLANANCLFVGTNLDQIHDTTCYSFLPELVMLSVLMGVTSFLMFFTSCCVYKSGTRYSNAKLRDDEEDDEE